MEVLRSMAQFQVQGVFAVGGSVVIAGQVQEGTIQVGQTADVNGTPYPISRIEKKHENVNQAQAGDLVGLTLQGLNDKTAITRGQVLTIR